jgi:hypothetical protein
MEMSKTAAIAACGLLVACFLGCKSPVPASPDAEPMAMTTSADEPKWVSAGARAFPEEAGKALYGIGVAAANRFPSDPFMLRKTAAERGRAEVAAQLRIMVASVLMDYAEAAFAPGMKPEEMQSLTENVQGAVADAALSGAQPTAAWKDPQTGATYVLVKLSLDDAAPQLRDKIIAAETGKLKMDADAAHKELDSIIEKNRQRPPK